MKEQDKVDKRGFFDADENSDAIKKKVSGGAWNMAEDMQLCRKVFSLNI